MNKPKQANQQPFDDEVNNIELDLYDFGNLDFGEIPAIDLELPSIAEIGIDLELPTFDFEMPTLDDPFQNLAATDCTKTSLKRKIEKKGFK